MKNKPTLNRKGLLLAKNCGAPTNILNKYDINKELKSITSIKYKNKTISVKQQLNFFNSTLESPLDNNYICVIVCNETPIKAQRLAYSIFLNAIEDNLDHTSLTKNLPLWYTIQGGYKNPLLEDEHFKLKVGNPALLVIDCLFDNSTDIKVEKVVDILRVHSAIPRILLLCCQVDLFLVTLQKLYANINRIIYLDNQRLVNI